MTTDSRIPLPYVKSEGRWQRAIRELDWLDTDSMLLDVTGRTIDSARRGIQQAIRKADRKDLYVRTDSAWLETRSPATMLVLLRVCE